MSGSTGIGGTMTTAFEDRLEAHRLAYSHGRSGYPLPFHADAGWYKSLSASWQLGALHRAQEVGKRDLHAPRPLRHKPPLANGL